MAKHSKSPPVMARWIDAFGQRYVAPASEYTPGQFSPTGSRMLGLNQNPWRRAAMPGFIEICIICYKPLDRGQTTCADPDTGVQCHAGCVAYKERKESEAEVERDQ